MDGTLRKTILLITITIGVIIGSISNESVLYFFQTFFSDKVENQRQVKNLFFAIFVIKTFAVLSVIIATLVQILGDKIERLRNTQNAIVTYFQTLFDSNSISNNDTYRITYFRFHQNTFTILLKRFLGYYFFHILATFLKENKVIKERLRYYDKERWPNLSSKYLQCAFRYGLEDGKIVTKKTSILQEVNIRDQYGILFGGKVFMLPENINICMSLQNLNINSIVKKIMNHAEKNNAYIDDFVSFRNIKIPYQVERLKNNQAILRIINSQELKELTDFMIETNTPASDLFNINSGLHSNYFLGCKVFDRKNKLVGVLMIDVKNESSNNFLEVIQLEDRLTQNIRNNVELKDEAERLLLGMSLKQFGTVFSYHLS